MTGTAGPVYRAMSAVRATSEVMSASTFNKATLTLLLNERLSTHRPDTVYNRCVYVQILSAERPIVGLPRPCQGHATRFYLRNFILGVNVRFACSTRFDTCMLTLLWGVGLNTWGRALLGGKYSAM